MKCLPRPLLICAIIIAFMTPAFAAAKPKLLNFGPWQKVPFYLGPSENNSIEIKIRTLLVDGKIKEFTTGDIHEVTDRFFVVRKAYRLNDWLPEDPKAKQHRWKWQRGGWLLVDRSTMRITQLNLPEFDPFYSGASWFRDYVAYCGLSDDATRVSAVVFQIGRKKPVLKQRLGEAKNGEMPESECETPQWERNPIRVTFQPLGGQKQTFQVFGHAADAMPVGGEEEQ
ncbi:MAG TPA: hypothetical protein VN577_16460 [Terriglobales bacterium]|nr:hypothetical protein [Terriglobales bacterium]